MGSEASDMKPSARATFTFIGGVTFAVFFAARAVIGADQAGGAPAATGVVLFLVAGAVFILVGLALQARPSLLAYRALQAEFPNATVARILASADFRFGVNRLKSLPPGAHVPRHVLVLISGDTIAFWSPRQPGPSLVLDLRDVLDVRVRSTSNTGYSFRHRVFVELSSGTGGRVSLPMVVLRNRHFTSFADGATAAANLAHSIERAKA